MKPLKTLVLAAFCSFSTLAFGQFYVAPSANAYINQDLFGDGAGFANNMQPVYFGLGASAGYAFEYWAMEVGISGYAPRTYDTIVEFYDALYGYLTYPATESSTLYDIGISIRYYSPLLMDYNVFIYTAAGYHRTSERVNRQIPSAYQYTAENPFTNNSFMIHGVIGGDIYLDDYTIIFIEGGVSYGLDIGASHQSSTFDVPYGVGWPIRAGVRVLMD